MPDHKLPKDIAVDKVKIFQSWKWYLQVNYIAQCYYKHYAYKLIKDDVITKVKEV